MEKKFEMIELLDTYGLLLSKRQRQVSEDYYCQDLSLSEIAENIGISRQAVNDALKAAEKTLFRYEKVLNLNKLHKKLSEAAGENKEELEKIFEELNKY